MRFNINKPSPELKVGQYGVDEEQLALLAELTGKAKVTLADVDQLSLRKTLTPAQRQVVAALQATARNTSRAANGRTMDGKGADDVASMSSHTLRTAKAALGEPEPVVKMRAALSEAGLWGQEQLLEPFVRLSKELYSPVRRNVPVMAIAGPEGHGKEQALAAFAKANGGNVHGVDFSAVTDSDAGEIFGGEGPLSIETLKKVKGVVHIAGVDGLAARAPKVAQQLCARFLAEVGEPTYVKLPYILDFSAGSEPFSATHAALGRAGSRTLVARGSFEPLTAETMLRYSDVALPKMLEVQRFGKVRLEMDLDARALLGEALATPHAPLHELTNRLQRSIITHVDTQTSINRADAVVRLSTADATVLPALHKADADLQLGENLFRAAEVGRAQIDGEKRQQAMDALTALKETFVGSVMPLLMDLSESVPPELQEEAMAEQEAVLDLLDGLDAVQEKLNKQLALAQRHGLVEMLSKETASEGVALLQQMQVAVGTLGETLESALILGGGDDKGVPSTVEAFKQSVAASEILLQAVAS